MRVVLDSYELSASEELILRAIVITSHGGPEVLALQERERPAFGAAEILVEVKATAINRADVIQRKGFYPAPPGCVADVPGLEYAGVVAQVGDDVTRFKIGDKVMGLMPGGTYQDFIAAHQSTVISVPPSLSLVEAAAIPEAFITAFDAAFLQANLKEGETLLVTAAASGVGLAAAQLANAFGCKSIGTVRQESKAAALKNYFDHVIVSPAADYADKVISYGGADVVLDLVGGDYVEENIKSANKHGRIMVVGLLAGSKCNISLNLLLAKRISIKGTTLRARPLEEKAEISRAFAERVLPYFVSGRLKPVIDQVFSLEQAAAAHQLMEENKNFGKIVLDLERKRA